MVNAEFSKALREKAAMLPLSPGVYIMKDKSSTVIYVGKSAALRNRVSQYFHDASSGSYKTDKMTSSVKDFDYILCDTEIEALALENSLIKLYKPRYNIKLKDDKSYPYIKLSFREDFPRLEVTRKRTDDGAKYFGPYTGMSTAYGIVDEVRRIFKLPFCKLPLDKAAVRARSCIYRQMRTCSAPCCGGINKEEYSEVISEASSFLGSSSGNTIKVLEEKMLRASDNLMFEAASKYRDRIAAIKRLDDKQKVVASSDAEHDVFGFFGGETISVMCVLYIRAGKLIDCEHFIFGTYEITDSSALFSLISDLYLKREYIPDEILLGFDAEESDIKLLSDWLRDKAGRKTSVTIPKRGEKKRLCEMACANAAQKATEYSERESRGEKVLVSLASAAGLETVPELIEAYDISNFGSEFITAGMITVEKSRFKKSGYRTFRIKTTEAQDDYASMREAISRRMKYWGEKEPTPDLLLLDGGAGHLSTIISLFRENDISIPVLAMVKDEHHKTRTLLGSEGEISIALDKALFTFIYKIQEEVHRYTIGSMSGAKRKTLKTSSLTQIPGIGKAKAALLLSKAGGLSGIKKASAAELALIKGISSADAENIYNYFHPSNNDTGTEQ